MISTTAYTRIKYSIFIVYMHVCTYGSVMYSTFYYIMYTVFTRRRVLCTML